MTLTTTIPVSEPDATRTQLPVPAHVPPRTVFECLALARAGLAEAAAIRSAGLRFAAAHTAALRAAAAVVAARGSVESGSRVSLWVLAVQVAPELSDWCAMFVAGATKRAAAEAGIPRVVTAAEAEECRAKASQFIDVVTVLLGGAVAGSPGDLPDCDGLPGDLGALVETIHARMGGTSRTDQGNFGAAWTLAIQAAAGADLRGVAGEYFDWRDLNLAATDREAANKLVALVLAAGSAK